MKTRVLLVLFVVLVNFSAFLYYSLGGYNSKVIDGTIDLDFYFYFLNIFLMFLALFITVSLYVFFDKFDFNKKISFSLRGDEHKIISLFVLFLQFFYLNGIWGSGSVAGAADILGGGVFGFVVAFFQIVSFALIYLVSIRFRDVFWWANLILYVFINLYQGWSAFIFCLFFVYLFDRERYFRPISYWKVIPLSFISVLLFYPFVYWFRLKVRLAGQQSISFFDVDVLMLLNINDFLDFSFYAYWKLLERFEQFYLSLGSLIYKAEIMYGFDSGLISKLYQEGPLKYIARNDSFSLGNYLPQVFYQDVGLTDYYWNISPGIVAYFFVDFADFIINLLVGVFVIFISALVSKILDVSKVLSDLIFFNLIFLFLAGWISQYLYFIYSVYVYVFVVVFIKLFVVTFRRM
ncbi:MAG: hypothetical protein COB58_01110 [Thalassobium sp.]|nr:MAG: hypothetical protein COB43_04485 [Oceanospirillales bacterium]PHQ88121.1 MAG: hypothetical protein COB58_01110 [Thalassobium sp.]